MKNGKIPKENLTFLAFEGGGGKGGAYLGAIQALEELGVLPSPDDPNYNFQRNAKITYESNAEGLFLVDTLDIEFLPGYKKGLNQIKGISGASAGAITAFMLAIGHNSKTIETFLAKKKRYKHKLIKGTPTTKSIFEAFMDYPDEVLVNADNIDDVRKKLFNIIPTATTSHYYRSIRYDNSVKKYLPDYKTEIIKPGFITNLGTNASISLVETMLKTFSEAGENSFYKRIFNYYEIDNFEEILKILGRTPLGLPNLLKNPKFKKNNFVTAYLMKNLLFHNGFFSGGAIRSLFKELIADLFIPELENIPNNLHETMLEHFTGTLSFDQFYKYTGVDLVLTGTNITTNRPHLFSMEFTPNFPIVEAVAISMNIPFVFKPIIIENSPQEELNGEWVDGGMLNNFPIHAFDHSTLSLSGKYERIGNFQSSIPPFSDHILGFRLSDGFRPGTEGYEKELDKIKQEELNKNNKSNKSSIGLFSFLGKALNTFMYPSEEGQIRMPKERDQVIELYAQRLDTLNFSPSTDELYGEDRESGPVPDAKKQTLTYFN